MSALKMHALSLQAENLPEDGLKKGRTATHPNAQPAMKSLCSRSQESCLLASDLGCIWEAWRQRETLTCSKLLASPTSSRCDE